jgi:hypothetical protein
MIVVSCMLVSRRHDINLAQSEISMALTKRNQEDCKTKEYYLISKFFATATLSLPVCE